MEGMCYKLRKKFDETIENNWKCKNDLKDIRPDDVLEMANNENKIFIYNNIRFCMFKYIFFKEDAIIMIFYIPRNVENDKRSFSERMFNILEDLERTFITLDYYQAIRSKQEECTYLICIKSLYSEG